MKRILLVINFKSGVGTAKTFHAKMLDIAKKNDLLIEFYETTGNEDGKAIRHSIEKFNPEIVYAVGGDGTVNTVASELINTDIILGVFPAGSANGLAYNLGITEDVEDSFVKILKKSPVEMDVIKINGENYCFHLSDIGVNARIVSRFEKEGSKGMLGYGKQLLKEIFAGKTWFSFYVQLPGQRRKKMKADMLVFANAKSYGTGAKINPTGKLNDGKFEIVILRPYPWWFVFTFVYAAFTGKMHKMKYIKVVSTKYVRIELEKRQEIQIDGEIFRNIKTIEAEIIPRAIKVLTGDSGKEEF